MPEGSEDRDGVESLNKLFGAKIVDLSTELENKKKPIDGCTKWEDPIKSSTV